MLFLEKRKIKQKYRFCSRDKRPYTHCRTSYIRTCQTDSCLCVAKFVRVRIDFWTALICRPQRSCARSSRVVASVQQRARRRHRVCEGKTICAIISYLMQLFGVINQPGEDKRSMAADNFLFALVLVQKCHPCSWISEGVAGFYSLA